MKITTDQRTKSNADRQRRFREAHREEYRANDRKRKRKTRAIALPHFIGVDSEGIGKGSKHRAVLLGVGDQQYIARDTRRGLQYQEVFDFLYQQFLRSPGAAYVGFYLSYDFNQWLRSLPRQAAWMLLTPRGKAMRKMTHKKARRRQYHPVRVDGWEIDLLGFKRLSIRPWCGHTNIGKCGCVPGKWMHICDAGPFYQMPFAEVCKPERWRDDPDGALCTEEEWKKLFAGKERRSYARLDDKMLEYNRLENELLARSCDRLARGFAKVGIKLAHDQWYGPGASASKWLQNNKVIKHRNLDWPEWFEEACRKSYYGGWFEIFSHGLILGESFNYDINNAYPFAASRLPHICERCEYRHGVGPYEGNGQYVLLSTTVHAKSNRIGPVPYRDAKGSILRPAASRGWYWQREIDASIRAGLVKKYDVHEWVEFVPCEHPLPFTEIEALYYERLRVGKDSAQGMAIKLNNNSIYGKFAQSVGSAPFNNWFYASLITSMCRIQILDAIATHPGRADSVLMVATDGICFDSPHPSLPISRKLGEWAATTYTDLCLFKPGVYWHKEGKEALLKVKSRGVPKAEFAAAVDQIEYQFRVLLDRKIWPGHPEHISSAVEYWDRKRIEYKIVGSTGWPRFMVPVKFRMKSCRQALNEGNWGSAAEIQEGVLLAQDSDPSNKRYDATYSRTKRRIDSHIYRLSKAEIETRYYGEVKYPRVAELGFGFDGNAIDTILQAGSVLRDKPANYDLPFDDSEIEWETVWGG